MIKKPNAVHASPFENEPDDRILEMLRPYEDRLKEMKDAGVIILKMLEYKDWRPVNHDTLFELVAHCYEDRPNCHDMFDRMIKRYTEKGLISLNSDVSKVLKHNFYNIEDKGKEILGKYQELVSERIRSHYERKQFLV